MKSSTIAMQTNIKALRSALAQVARAIGNDEGLGLVKGLVTLVGTADHLEVQKTNLLTYAKAVIPVRNGTSFKMTIDGKRLCDLLGTSDDKGDVTIKVETDCLRVSFGKAKIKVPDLQQNDTPLLDAALWGPAKDGFNATVSSIKTALKQAVINCADKCDARYYLHGVCFTTKVNDDNSKSLVLVGTNGHTLTVCDTDVGMDDTWKDAIVPVGVINALIATLDDTATLSISRLEVPGQPKGIGFKSETFEVVCQTIEGKYPAWKKVIPAESAREQVNMNVAEFNNSVTRMGLVSTWNGSSSKTHTAIKLSVGQGCMIVSDVPRDADESIDTIDFKEGSPQPSAKWASGFNHAYISDCLTTAPDEDVTLHIDPLFAEDQVKRSLLITGKNWKTVIMAMTI